MPTVSMKQLLEAGVHFGHQTRRWNPKMKRFIFGERNGIYIIDLNQTLVRIEAAYTFVRDLAAEGGTILFVGTKKQTQDPIANAANKCGMPYVNERWLGGMLTNFTTISARVKKMQEYERMKEAGDFEAMPKKEALILSRELEKLQRNLRLRAQMVGIIRRSMEEAGFLDIQTPILFKPTPEGARDFVVPSRLQKGRFFALPQSPQILKQLTMVAGFDRYYQIAICFRDEDLRADRVQEITQLDVEMSFPDQEELFRLMEGTFAAIWRECLGIEIETPFPRLTHAEADRRFGSDKPDTRFGLELEDATEATRGSAFGVFAGAPAVRFLRVPRPFSRAELGALEEVAKARGAKGLAYLVRDEQTGELRSPIAKFLSAAELEALAVRPGETLLFAADEWATTSRVLGHLRLHLARELGLVDESAFTFLWVTDFPMFERDEEEGHWGAVHHPFTRPAEQWRDRFAADPGNALAHAYDLIVNGNELGGGSFRIHEPELQAQVFDLLGIGPEEQRAKFGFLLDALAMGAPPHGGIALGIDRMAMVLAGEPNLRDVIAFPKNQAGLDPMSGAPSEVTQAQLDELGLRLVEEPSP